MNSHNFGVNPELFRGGSIEDQGLASMYKLTSVSYELSTGNPFSATIEGYNYPFFGTQFHPEKTMTMFNDSNIDHSF